MSSKAFRYTESIRKTIQKKDSWCLQLQNGQKLERHSIFPRTPSPIRHKQANKNLLELKKSHTHTICAVSVPACVLSRFCLVQLCCYPMYCSSLGSSVHGILQASRVEQVAISSPRGYSQKYKHSLSFSIQDSF